MKSDVSEIDVQRMKREIPKCYTQLTSLHKEHVLTHTVADVDPYIQTHRGATLGPFP